MRGFSDTAVLMQVRKHEHVEFVPKQKIIIMMKNFFLCSVVKKKEENNCFEGE